ncbi:MAG: hypothetical protein D6729_05270, partial [Deltaproteobacteria bacterium]
MGWERLEQLLLAGGLLSPVVLSAARARAEAAGGFFGLCLVAVGAEPARYLSTLAAAGFLWLILGIRPDLLVVSLIDQKRPEIEFP